MAIDVTGIDLVKFAQDVYDLSTPQGLGFLQATPAPLAEDDARALVERERPGGFVALSMDYVRGRACKMSVHREYGKLSIPGHWFDHSDEQLDTLLARHKHDDDCPAKLSDVECTCGAAAFATKFGRGKHTR